MFYRIITCAWTTDAALTCIDSTKSLKIYPIITPCLNTLTPSNSYMHVTERVKDHENSPCINIIGNIPCIACTVHLDIFSFKMAKKQSHKTFNKRNKNNSPLARLRQPLLDTQVLCACTRIRVEINFPP